MRLNKLKLNSDKSELLVISSKYRPCPSLDSISISEQVVNSSVSARNLGLIVDDSLSLEEHVIITLDELLKSENICPKIPQQLLFMLSSPADWTTATHFCTAFLNI